MSAHDRSELILANFLASYFSRVFVLFWILAFWSFLVVILLNLNMSVTLAWKAKKEEMYDKN